MMRGALHRLKTLPFRRSTRFSHFRSNPQIFDTGFSRLFPSYFSPSHHSPRSFPGHPARAPRSARFSALYAQLEKPVKELKVFRIKNNSGSYRGTKYRDMNYRGTKYRDMNYPGTKYCDMNYRGTKYRDMNYCGMNHHDMNCRGMNHGNMNYRGSEIP